jgi:hypothetical protein
MPTDKNSIPMTTSGFCQFPSEDFGHEYCQIREFPCTCGCHERSSR